jgi:hypothetical protein
VQPVSETPTTAANAAASSMCDTVPLPSYQNKRKPWDDGGDGDQPAAYHASGETLSKPLLLLALGTQAAQRPGEAFLTEEARDRGDDCGGACDGR